jgi:(p)ppGpp synthase/HD superfamily hydrolase
MFHFYTVEIFILFCLLIIVDHPIHLQPFTHSAMFGREVRNIVEGETKVSKLPKLAFADYADEQAENLRQENVKYNKYQFN